MAYNYTIFTYIASSLRESVLMIDQSSAFQKLIKPYNVIMLEYCIRLVEHKNEFIL